MGTGMPRSSPSRLATGASESSGSSVPSVGRPRCEVTMTAAPLSSACWIPGTEARMRVSSVMRPSSMGTLRSARMNTFLPRRSTSDMRLNFMRLLRERYANFSEDGRDVEHAVREAPLVVVPGGHLDERAVGRDAGEGRVEDRARRVVVEVGGDQLLGVVLEDALEVAVAARLHRL